MNIVPLLKAKYPQGSIGGQCGDFAHKIVDFPSVGNSYKEKQSSVRKFGILKDNLSKYQVGDVLITDEGTFLGTGNGHVAVCTNPDTLEVAESNFKKDGRVRYGRRIDKKRIYGVIRGNFRLDPQIKYPVILNTTVFMQYPKQWNSKIFGEFSNKVFELTGGKIQLNIFPLYTYYTFKNWWYAVYHQNYKVIAKEYLDDQVKPLVFPDSKFVLWSINKQQWEGSLFNNPEAQELGWYYPNSPYALIVGDEGDMSFYNYGEKAFIDYGVHEFAHFLYDFGRPDQVDLTHQRFYDRQMDKVKDDIDFKRFILNI